MLLVHAYIHNYRIIIIFINLLEQKKKKRFTVYPKVQLDFVQLIQIQLIEANHKNQIEQDFLQFLAAKSDKKTNNSNHFLYD
jgi:hypothetical protein